MASQKNPKIDAYLEGRCLMAGGDARIAGDSAQL